MRAYKCEQIRSQLPKKKIKSIFLLDFNSPEWKTKNNVHGISNVDVQGAKRRDLRFLNLELSPSLRSDEQYKEEVHLEVQVHL